jgi:hypothetical protein
VSPEELASFKRQLASAVEAAAKRKEVVVGYEWRGGHLSPRTVPANRRAKPAPAPAPVAKAERRVAQRGAARFIQERLL